MTSSSHHHAPVASFFSDLEFTRAEAVEMTIEFSVVKVKRQSLNAPELLQDRF
jgi:hypothetical protein